MSSEEMELSKHLKQHVEELAGTIGEHNLFHEPGLRAAQRYLETIWQGYGYVVQKQEYKIGELPVANLEVELPGKGRPDEIIVVGAHYDSVLGSPGANDNGTGIATILEMARLLKDQPRERTLRLVAFVNEEPPYFQTPRMGSLVYAQRSRQRREKIVGMISVETIGFYSDAPHSQHYPFPFSLFYPNTGNFIGFVANTASRDLVRRSIGSFRQHTQFPSEGAAVPGWIQGIGWSDHWSFWQQGYPAIMITDTAPFRYPYYHTPQDTPDKVDFDRTARVVAGLARVVTDLAGAPGGN